MVREYRLVSKFNSFQVTIKSDYTIATCTGWLKNTKYPFKSYFLLEDFSYDC